MAIFVGTPSYDGRLHLGYVYAFERLLPPGRPTRLGLPYLSTAEDLTAAHVISDRPAAPPWGGQRRIHYAAAAA